MRSLDLRRLRRPTAALAVASLLALAAAAAAAQTAAIGLSTVRAQRFGNENLLGFYTPQGGDFFAAALAAGDFNGDGADDLATGLPGDNGLTGSPVTDSGTVIVRYGSPAAGLATNLASTVLRQTPARDPAEAGDAYGSALAACDFNGDDFDDLAVGVPLENYAGYYDAGAVQIHYGSSGGIHTSGDAFYTESTGGITGDVEDYDRFGSVLACGDFDADGNDDLVIGVPNESWGGFNEFDLSWGQVIIIPGSGDGLVPAQARSFDQDSPGMSGGPENGDSFGKALAAGDFDSDGFDDLAIGVPGEDGVGRLQVVFGGAGGLTAAGNLFWSETFVGGLSEASDNFALSLAAADFDGDGFDDLAVGIPYENLGGGNSIADAGAFDVLYGAPGGFDLSHTQFFEQGNVLGAGTDEANDTFGATLAAADFDRDGFADLAVGHPTEYVSGPGDGAVTVLVGSAAGLTAARHRGIAAGYDGFPGDVLQHNKSFAAALTHGDFDGDGHADLAIGAPFEDVGGTADVGTETVLYGALYADGVESGNTNLWSQNVSSLYFNKTRVTSAAKLGPTASKLGLQVDLFAPTIQRPATSTYVRVGGPEMGFHDERTLNGSFFIDPQGLTMSATAGIFQMMAFNDALGSGAKNRLAFDLTRNATTWSIVANYFNDAIGGLAFAGSGAIAQVGDANGHNTRIDFAWRAGNPGHLTMWRTRYVNGVPDARVLLFDVDLSGAQSSVINHVLAGMVVGQDPGTFGPLYLDELSFRR